MNYWVGAAAFPAHAHYVALGHLHRTQQIAGAAPIWYSGSPLQVDFGERDEPSNVLVVEARPGVPAQSRPVGVSGSRRLRTLQGSLEQLREFAGKTSDDFLRVIVEEPGRAGLAETVQDLLGPGVVEVRLESIAALGSNDPSERRSRLAGQTPHELFDAYLVEQGIDDRRITALFAELLDEESH
jgi:exonuclease SbcD